MQAVATMSSAVCTNRPAPSSAAGTTSNKDASSRLFVDDKSLCIQQTTDPSCKDPSKAASASTAKKKVGRRTSRLIPNNTAQPQEETEREDYFVFDSFCVCVCKGRKCHHDKLHKAPELQRSAPETLGEVGCGDS
jgi:hypothetical protein